MLPLLAICSKGTLGAGVNSRQSKGTPNRSRPTVQPAAVKSGTIGANAGIPAKPPQPATLLATPGRDMNLYRGSAAGSVPVARPVPRRVAIVVPLLSFSILSTAMLAR